MSIMCIRDLRENDFTVFPEDMAVAYSKGIADVPCIFPRIDGWGERHGSGELLFWKDAGARRTPFLYKTRLKSY